MRPINLKTEQHNQWKLALTAIVLLGILAKLIIFLSVYHGNISQITQPDSESYIAPAIWLLKTGHYMTSAHSFMLQRTPGYPTFIAAIFYCFGHNLSAIIIAQVFLMITPTLCAFFIARRLFSTRIALWAALLVAADYLLLSYTFLVLTESLFVSLLCLALTFGVYLLTINQQLQRTNNLSKYTYAFSFGLFLALATLTRPVSYFLIIPILIGSVGYFISQKTPVKAVTVIALLILLPTLILVGGWQLRNKTVSGSFKYTSLNSTQTVNQFFPGITPNNSNTSTSKDILILLKHPLPLIKQLSIGAARLMLGPDRALPQLFGDRADIKSFRVIKYMLLHHQFKRAIQEFKTGHFSVFMLAYLVAALVINIVLYILAAIGLIKLFKSRLFHQHKFAHLLLLGCALYFILLSSNAFTNARFRVPIQLMIDTYAVAGFLLPRHCLAFRDRA